MAMKDSRPIIHALGLFLKLRTTWIDLAALQGAFSKVINKKQGQRKLKVEPLLYIEFVVTVVVGLSKRESYGGLPANQEPFSS